MRFLSALLIIFSVLCYGQQPQAPTNQSPAANPAAAPRPQAPAPGQFSQQAADARRMDYDINTLRSMLYQMKSDLSRVPDSATRSALLVDSQMWEWVIADMQRRAAAMRMPQAPPPAQFPRQPEAHTPPRGVKDPNQ